MWKSFWKRKADAAFILTSPKSGRTTVGVDGLTATRLRLMLENHAYALHFTGPEEELLATLQRLAPAESLDVSQWRIVRGETEGTVAQVRLTGKREIRRLIRLVV